jgi:hypothetical protein
MVQTGFIPALGKAIIRTVRVYHRDLAGRRVIHRSGVGVLRTGGCGIELTAAVSQYRRQKGGGAVRTSRLEAFSDGVLAIIITIMVLELKVPEGHDLSDLVHTTGVGLLTYLLSFVYVGIYWNNHHHMFHLVRRVSGGVLWANLTLLFCLSLFPFTTAWMDDRGLSRPRSSSTV